MAFVGGLESDDGGDVLSFRTPWNEVWNNRLSVLTSDFYLRIIGKAGHMTLKKVASSKVGTFLHCQGHLLCRLTSYLPVCRYVTITITCYVVPVVDLLQLPDEAQTGLIINKSACSR